MTTRRAILAAPFAQRPCFSPLIRRTDWHGLLRLDLAMWGQAAHEQGVRNATVTLAARHEGLAPARGIFAHGGVRFAVRVAREPLPFDEDWRVEARCGWSL